MNEKDYRARMNVLNTVNEGDTAGAIIAAAGLIGALLWELIQEQKAARIAIEAREL